MYLPQPLYKELPSQSLAHLGAAGDNDKRYAENKAARERIQRPHERIAHMERYVYKELHKHREAANGYERARVHEQVAFPKIMQQSYRGAGNKHSPAGHGEREGKEPMPVHGKIDIQ